ncbi:MAG: DUF2283 domain-containing protein [Planctomycetota bacterium]|jgi:uncharacterized protein YuzE
MNDRYLEVTYRGGKPLAAYLHLPRLTGAKSARTRKAGAGLVVDYDENGRPIGLEITDPAGVTVEQINETLVGHGLPEVTPEELSPLAST